MKTWDNFVAEGIPEVINDYGEHRKTSRGSIVFPNGWVASIASKKDHPNMNSKYSVATCDYNGYFDWNVLKPFGEDNGTIHCETEEEVANAIFIISQLR